MSFKNEYLSVSRLKKYEQCPKAFEFHYVKGIKSKDFQLALAFGTMLHKVLEDLFRWVIDEEFQGFLPLEKAIDFYKKAWSESGIVGIDVYNEGVKIVRDYIRRHPEVNHFNILAVEAEFNLQLEEFRVNGRIDRVDRIDDETIEVVDFKSNRMLFTRDEVDTDLQMSVYALAARQMWPWAKKMRFTFDMLRHDTRMTTYRSEEEMRDAADYVVAIGRNTEKGLYPARLNSNCGYCDHRNACIEYQDAVTKRVEMFSTGDDLEKIAALREKVATVAKLAYAKQRDLDAIIKARLEHAENQELVLAGTRFRLVPSESIEYPAQKTLSKLVLATGKPRDELLDSVFKVDKKRLEEELSALPAAKKMVVEAEIEAIAVVTPSTPRINASKVKDSAPAKKPSRKKELES